MSIFRYEPHPALTRDALGELDTLLNELALQSNLVELPINQQLARTDAQLITGSPVADGTTGPTEEDVKEFKLLESAITDTTVQEYLQRRCTTFGDAPGADTEYRKYAAVADAEFEPIKNLIGQAEDSPDRRRVLYRWLKKAYAAKGITDPASVIKAGIHPDMKQKLDAVKDKLGGRKPEGFAARPAKPTGSGEYQLGTLSKHATGKAIDLASAKNPQLEQAEWNWLKTFTGESPDVSYSTWQTSPAQVWKAVNDMNEAFKTKLKEAVDTAMELTVPAPAQPGTTGAAPPAPKPKFATRKDAIAEVLQGKAKLLKCVNAYGEDHGFFELPEDLVVALADQGLTWGATFPTFDPMHFEIPIP